MELPTILTKASWDKNKGLLNKIGTPDTGIGELLKTLKTSFDQVAWEKLDKKKALKDADRDFGKFETAYQAAKPESVKAEKLAVLLQKIVTTGAEFKAKIKQAGLVSDAAKKFRVDVLEAASLDWDDERISLREAQEELDFYIKARARALDVAKKLRKTVETDAQEAKNLGDDVRKAATDVETAKISLEQKQKLLVDMAGWVKRIQEIHDADAQSFEDKFAKDKEIMDQRQSPKHDIKEALNKAGGDFNLQMTEVDAIQKALRTIEEILAIAEGDLEGARDELEADKRSNAEWRKSLDATIRELAVLVKGVRDACEYVAGKAKLADKHVEFMLDKKSKPEDKEKRRLILPAIRKEVEKQHNNFLVAVSAYVAKAKRVEKVPVEMKGDNLVKPVIAAVATMTKMVEIERQKEAAAKKSFEEKIEKAMKG